MDTNTGTMNKKKNARLPLAVVLITLIVCVAVAGVFTMAGCTQKTDSDTDSATNASSQKEVDVVEQHIKALSPEQKVAQLFVVTPESITGVGVTIAAGETTRQALLEYPVGGICYFAQNLQTPEQTKEMLQNSQEFSEGACGLPLLTCVDEEGGTVTRIASNEAFGVEDVGDMAAIGEAGSTSDAQDAAYYVGSYLKDLGFNVDFAPVADIATSDDKTMALRSFGQTPEDVAPMVAAQVRGFAKAGILCSAKHFPGIGSAEGDSHNVSIYTDASLDDMRAWSLVPFEAAIKEQVPLVMVGHLTCAGLTDANTDLPASLNPAVIDGILRKQLGYEGLVITDSLEMEAAVQACEPNQQAVLAIQAGADLVLMPKDFEQAYNGLLEAVREGEVSESRIDESLRRIISAKLGLV